MVDQRTTRLHISIGSQRLTILTGLESVEEYSISSAVNGVGAENGSGCTPTGQFRIRIKIGSGLPLNSVFIGRRPTGEILTRALFDAEPQRDWVLTRILWLTGVESGLNRGGERDTLRRYIYIHGTPDYEPIGMPLSHGCIRMRNSDIIKLFDQVSNGSEVEIVP